MRGLRAAGYAPIAALVSEDALALRSRAPVAKVMVPDAAADPAGHQRALVRVAEVHGAVAVLPGTEASLRALADHGGSFGSNVAVGAPASDVVERATDKSELAQLAAHAGLRTPPTREVASAAAYDGPFPAIVKPHTSISADPLGQLHQVTVARVADRRELTEALAAVPGATALVQPFVPGRLRTVNGVAWQGRVVCSVHKRSDRTWPFEAGSFAYGQTIAKDKCLEAACATLFADLGWSGLFNVQFLEDRTRDLLLIDLNPRAYHSLALAIGAGANLPGVWCDLLLGRPPRAACARPGVRFRSEEDDLRALRSVARTDGVVAAAAALLPRPRTVHALFGPGDPGPLLHVARAWVRRRS